MVISPRTVAVDARNGVGTAFVTAVWGHRGAPQKARENTLESFRVARQEGADGVELDVRTAADGVVVVHHDALLADGRPVAEVPSADLPAWLPTLEAALEELRDLTVDVEVKSLPTDPGWDPGERAAAATAQLVVRMGRASRVVVSSFSMAAIDRVKATAPGLRTGWLTVVAYDQLEAVDLAATSGHDALHPRHEVVTPDLVVKAHGRGLAVHAWTADEPDDIRRVAAAGADAVITNLPAAALEVLGRRNA